MAGMSWRNPPPSVAIGGTETYLRDREIRKAIRVTAQGGRPITSANTEGGVVDALTLGATFGTPGLILTDPEAVYFGQVIREANENPQKGSCILVVVDGKLDEKKFPFLAEIHGAYQVSHMRPTTKKGRHELALKFAVAEAGSLMGTSKALGSRLAEALVKAVGVDLGVVAHEVLKITALARAEGAQTISVEHVKALVRPSSVIDMEPLRQGLRMKDQKRVAAALERIRRVSPTDPVMLLLRARGGPADLVLKWLRTAVLLEKGATPSEISSRTSTPEWAVKKDLIPAARRWGATTLRKMTCALAQADRGTLKGAPSPWVACETALLLGCAAPKPGSL